MGGGQRCFEIKCASVHHVHHVAHAKVQSLCQERTENSECDIKCVEEYTIASNTLKNKAVDFNTALGTLIGNVSCTSKSCGVLSSIANALHTSVERYYLDFVAYNRKSGYSLDGLRNCKKEFLSGCKSDGTYDVPHLTCQSINCILDDAPKAKRIEFSSGSLPSSSPAMLGSNEWLENQCGESPNLSGILGSSDLFAMRCLDGDHTMTHCKPVQCGDPSVIAHATSLGGCFVTTTYGKQVEDQCEAGYHVKSERKSGSKPEGCHTKERAEPEQPVQAPEELMGAVSSCGHAAPPEERFALWIGQQDPQPRRAWAQFFEWLEDTARCDEMSQWAVLVTGPPSTSKTAGVRLLSGHVRGTFLECDTREVEGRKFAKLIMKGQRGLRPTSVAILNIDTDVTDELKWMLCKAAQQLQIPPIFVCDDGVVAARNELVQKCLCLEVRHEAQNVEQALRRMTQRNVPEVLELLEQDGEEFCRALQRQYFTSCGENFETLDQCAFAAMIATLSAETSLPKGRFGQPLDRSQSRGAQDDTDELDRMREDQDEQRKANERRTSNARRTRLRRPRGCR